MRDNSGCLAATGLSLSCQIARECMLKAHASIMALDLPILCATRKCNVCPVVSLPTKLGDFYQYMLVKIPYMKHWVNHMTNFWMFLGSRQLEHLGLCLLRDGSQNPWDLNGIQSPFLMIKLHHKIIITSCINPNKSSFLVNKKYFKTNTYQLKVHVSPHNPS